MTDDEAIIDALRNRKKIALTAPDLAALLDSTRSTVYKRLQKLAEEGRVESMKVASKGRVWYLPDDIERLGPDYMGEVEQVVIPTYMEYLHKPVDARGRFTVHVDYAEKTLTLALMDPTVMRTVDVDEWDYENPMRYHRAREIMTLEADDRGRVAVGKEYSGQKISMALLEVQD